MVVTNKLEPLDPPKEANITFKDVLKDGITFIEVTSTGKVTLSKQNKDRIVWNVDNLSSFDVEVKVIDFWPQSTSSGGPTSGGTPFAGGKGPEKLKVIKGVGHTAHTTPLFADGDPDIIYKYSIVARIADDPNPWFLVKDPELEIDI